MAAAGAAVASRARLHPPDPRAVPPAGARRGTRGRAKVDPAASSERRARSSRRQPTPTAAPRATIAAKPTGAGRRPGGGAARESGQIVPRTRPSSHTHLVTAVVYSSSGVLVRCSAVDRCDRPDRRSRRWRAPALELRPHSRTVAGVSRVGRNRHEGALRAQFECGETIVEIARQKDSRGRKY